MLLDEKGEPVGVILSHAIPLCLEAREKAILIKTSSTKVGACLWTSENFYEGYNIQNRSHKSYHAEEIACLNYLMNRKYKDEKILGMTVSFSSRDIERLTFCCGHCRQIMWETSRNPDMTVIEISLDGDIIKEEKLSKLYPYPYPRRDYI